MLGCFRYRLGLAVALALEGYAEIGRCGDERATSSASSSSSSSRVDGAGDRLVAVVVMVV